MTDSSPLDAAGSRDLRPAVASDAPLVGDRAAALQKELEQLYRSHYAKVAGYFRRSGQTEALAAELAQEAFINALRGLPQFHGGSKLSTWLWTIARNVLLAHVRSPAHASASAEEDVDPDGLSNVELPHQNLMRDCVKRGFEAFSKEHPERAQVVYLAVVEGWTRAELAEFLGRSEHAATEYLSQCKARFKPFIEQCNGC